MNTRDLALIALFAALTAVCAWIAVPAPVPFTLQTFAVFLTAGLLGGRRGALSVLTYILLGAVGLPVFAHFTGGIGVLLGNTGGYILGFIGLTLTMWLITRAWGDTLRVLGIAMAAGLLVCYALGTAWFMLVYTRTTGPIGLANVLTACVLPFVVPDVVKIALALLLIRRLKKQVPD